MYLYDSIFQFNSAWRGMIELRDYGYMYAYQVQFYRNRAFFAAGAIYVGTFSYMNISGCQFTSNTANQSSAIEVLQSNRLYNVTIYNS